METILLVETVLYNKFKFNTPKYCQTQDIEIGTFLDIANLWGVMLKV